MKKEMTLGERTCLVIDQASNRFNFCWVDVDEQLMQQIIEGREYELERQQLPKDVSTAVETMIDNDCKIEDFTGVVRFKNGETTYYVLTW